MKTFAHCAPLCVTALLSCQPLHDLDAASEGENAALGPSESSGDSQTADSATATESTATSGPTMPTEAALPTAVNPTLTSSTTSAEPPSRTPAGPSGAMPNPAGPNVDAGIGGLGSGGRNGVAPVTGLAGIGGSGGSGGSNIGGAAGHAIDGGAAGAAGGGAGGEAGGATTRGGPTPLDLPGNPVPGTFTVATDAEWEVEGTFLPTFEIITPTAGYWVVKDLGMIVSIVDRNEADPRQWIAFSSGFRPLRGLPSFGTFGSAPAMTTTMDEDNSTPTHVRLMSVSDTGDWQLVYDFYPTHVTLTVDAAPTPFGIAYRGVPGGELDASDRFVLADGASQDATISSLVDLPGPMEWAYIADTGLGRSFFSIHHGDDALTDRYQVRDNDSPMISFGDGDLMSLPARFSFGLIESSAHETVTERVEFIIGAIPPP